RRWPPAPASGWAPRSLAPSPAWTAREGAATRSPSGSFTCTWRRRGAVGGPECSGRAGGPTCGCGRRLQRFTCCASISAPIRVTPALEVRPTARLVFPRTFVRRKLGARWFAGKGVEEMERDQALEAAVSQIERQFGKGALMKMGEAGHVELDE